MILYNKRLYGNNIYIQDKVINCEYFGQLYYDNDEFIHQHNLKETAFICKNIHINNETGLLNCDIHILDNYYGNIIKTLLYHKNYCTFYINEKNNNIINIICFFEFKLRNIRLLKIKEIFNEGFS